MSEQEFRDWQEALQYAVLSGRDRHGTPEALMEELRREGTPAQTAQGVTRLVEWEQERRTRRAALACRRLLT